MEQCTDCGVCDISVSDSSTEYRWTLGLVVPLQVVLVTTASVAPLTRYRLLVVLLAYVTFNVELLLACEWTVETLED